MSQRKAVSGRKLGGFVTTNLTLYVQKLFKNFEISVSVYNHLDKKYADAASDEHPEDAIPQDGRNYRLKLTYLFQNGNGRTSVTLFEIPVIVTPPFSMILPYLSKVHRLLNSPPELSRQPWSHVALAAVVAFVCLPPFFCKSCLATGPSEYKVKAAFLYNFIKFSEWPQIAFSSPNSAIVVLVIGEDPITDEIQALNRNLCLEAGMDDYMSKPFTESQLLEVLEKWIKNQDYVVHEAEKTEPVKGHDNSQSCPEMECEIDWTALDRIRSLQEEGEPDVLKTVIATYFEDSPLLLASIKEALGGKNGTVLVRATHTLKSTSANLGAISLSTLCKDLEAMAKSGVTDRAEELIRMIEQEYSSVRVALSGELQGGG